jgi:hypothetical protein
MSDDKATWTEATLETLYDQGWDANPAVAGLKEDGTSVDPVPEPASFALLGLGLLPLGWRLRKRRA